MGDHIVCLFIYLSKVLGGQMYTYVVLLHIQYAWLHWRKYLAGLLCLKRWHSSVSVQVLYSRHHHHRVKMFRLYICMYVCQLWHPLHS